MEQTKKPRGATKTQADLVERIRREGGGGVRG